MKKGLVFLVPLPGLQFPFFVTMKNDLDQLAARLGVTVVYIDARNNSADQAAAVETFASMRLNGILISPMTVDSLVPTIEAAAKAGIPVATVDRKANTDKVLVHVGADNVEGGRAAARYIVQKLGGKGGVIELEGTPGASPAIDRKKGFDEVIAHAGSVHCGDAQSGMALLQPPRKETQMAEVVTNALVGKGSVLQIIRDEDAQALIDIR